MGWLVGWLAPHSDNEPRSLPGSSALFASLLGVLVPSTTINSPFGTTGLARHPLPLLSRNDYIHLPSHRQPVLASFPRACRPNSPTPVDSLRTQQSHVTILSHGLLEPNRSNARAFLKFSSLISSHRNVASRLWSALPPLRPSIQQHNDRLQEAPNSSKSNLLKLPTSSFVQPFRATYSGYRDRKCRPVGTTALLAS